VKVKLRKKTKEIKTLFFVHKGMTELLYNNPEVLIMDCTYKTNRYRMPLLTICGVTSLGTTFIVGFAFVHKETKEYYDWILYYLVQLYESLGLPFPRVIATDRDLALMEAIDGRFPRRPTAYGEGTRHVLCLWHLHRNVAKNCKASFATDEDWEAFLAAWHAVIYGNNHAEFKAAWIQFVTTYWETHSDDINYIIDTWLEPWRDRLCKYHTNEFRHYGITTTSRAEGIHRVLKSNLKLSTGDLMTVVDNIELMLVNQLKKHRKDLAQAKRSTPFAFSHTVFSNLVGRVTPYAIWKIHSQFQRLQEATAEEPLPPCTEVFTKTLGLPCSHKIKARMEAVDGGLGRLQMEDIDSHWWFKKPDYGRQATADFHSDLRAMNEAIAEPLDSVEDVLDIGLNTDEPLPSIDDILQGLEAHNLVHRPTPEPPEPPEPAAELIDDDIELLDVNEPRIAKAKGRPVGAKNRKGIMTRAEKAKAKSTRRDPSGFEHVDAAIQASRGRGRRGGRGGAITGPRKASRKRQAAPFTAATIDAHIRTMEEVDAEIDHDVRGIITRQAARKAAEQQEASTSTGITTMEAIHIDTDEEFNVDDDGDADQSDEWM